MTISQAVESTYKYWQDSAMRITKDPNAADDLLHDTLDRCIRGKTFAGICEREEHRNYVVRAMRISYKGGYFCQQFRQKVEQPIDIEGTSDEVWLGHRMINEQLDVIINKLLPEFDRDLLEVHIFNDFNLKKTAQVTGIPKAYIKRNIAYSLNKIRNVVSK